VPLNSVIRVVFTTPVTRAAAEAAVRLLRGGEVVEGTVRMNGDADVVVDFEPAARLAANADYELQVDGALRDVLGTALEAPVAVPFTTGTTEAPATAVGLQVGRFGAIPRFTLALGDSVELVAYAYGSARIPIRQEISWTSSRETVLQVRAVPVPPSAPLGSRAIMRGVGGGAVVVQAAVGSVSGGFGLFVNDPGSVVPVSGRLVVTRSTASGIRLVAVDADGGNAAPLLAAGTQPTAAPDGRIAYVTSQGEISVLQGGAQVVRFERPQSGALMCPAFSPDGEWLAYVRRRYGPDFSDWFADEVELVVARSAPPEIEVIVFLSPRGDATPCGYWSPDGRRLAYTLDGDAWIVDLQLDGSSSPRVSPSRRLVAGWSAGPFSPDGSRMASLRSWRSAGAELGFVSVADGSVDLGDRFFWQQYGWRLYRSDDTEPRTLGPNGWSADGSWFVFDLSQQYGVGIARPGRAGVGLLLEGSFPAVMPSIATGSTREP
jgi:hypothetical protein